MGVPKILVEDVRVNQPDENGQPIDTVYYRNPPLYAVYRTDDRVLIEFADDIGQEKAQRTAMAPLAPLRGQINSLIDGWRISPKPKLRERACRYDRRVADALLIGLETDIPAAASLLAEIKDDLIEERKSWAKVLYLACGSLTALAALCVMGFVTSDWYRAAIYPVPALAGLLLTAAGAGTVGALFSIAQQIRSRSILTDLQMRDNIADAILRVLVGAVGGAVLAALMFSGLASLSINNSSFGGAVTCAKDCTPEPETMKLLLIGFVAGFLERLVPDLLAKASLAESSPPKPAAPGAEGGTKSDGGAARAAPQSQPNPDPADLGAPGGDGAAPEDGDPDDTDACLCHAPAADAELTSDANLPAASGGVATPTDQTGDGR